MFERELESVRGYPEAKAKIKMFSMIDAVDYQRSFDQHADGYIPFTGEDLHRLFKKAIHSASNVPLVNGDVLEEYDPGKSEYVEPYFALTIVGEAMNYANLSEDDIKNLLSQSTSG